MLGSAAITCAFYSSSAWGEPDRPRTHSPEELMTYSLRIPPSIEGNLRLNSQVVEAFSSLPNVLALSADAGITWTRA